ncbi:unnamed protein product, partial [Discosporangium mesarthrocarpum]
QDHGSAKVNPLPARKVVGAGGQMQEKLGGRHAMRRGVDYTAGAATATTMSSAGQATSSPPGVHLPNTYQDLNAAPSLGAMNLGSSAVTAAELAQAFATPTPTGAPLDDMPPTTATAVTAAAIAAAAAAAALASAMPVAPATAATAATTTVSMLPGVAQTSLAATPAVPPAGGM